MKLAQTILVLLFVNIMYLFVNFAIEYQSIDNLNENVINRFNERFSSFSDFGDKTGKEESFAMEILGSVIGGLLDAFNLVFLGLQIIGLILMSYFMPAYEIFFDENITILGILGMIAMMYIYWFNVLTIIKLWKFLKGSDQ